MTLLIACTFLLLVAAICIAGVLPIGVFWLYVGASLIALIVYAIDKSAARRGGSRVPESTLHLLSVLGGWPGALYAQQSLRHKTRKTRFRIQFVLTVIVNVSVLALAIWAGARWH